MKRSFIDFVCFSALLTAVFGASAAGAAQAPNPRNSIAGARSDANVLVRGGDAGSGNVSTGRTSARTASTVVRSGANVSRSATTARTGVNNARSATNARTSTSAPRAATVSRAGVNSARSAMNVIDSGIARSAARARATAVFTDISKIGGGYAACREAYATCMDQFCANANDKYRRCYCSEKFTEFRNTEDALDQAKTLLMQFEDNNLNAVDKTAAEVEAMYSATVGEAAIKNDTSAAQNILNEIGDLLSGKRKTSTGKNSSSSLGVLSLDFSTDVDDVWGGGGSSIFDMGTGVDLTSLEGADLYNASNKQCLQLIGEQCENSATLNMATSAYGIMITQDCNAYEKNLNSKREGVMQTVRQAEKILREARLEEYRAHNSADVNECIAKVKSAITSDSACGVNYKRCLDYSGKYVSPTTGEVTLYDTSLFKLSEQITLTGGMDVLGDNPNFNKFLDDKKLFASAALDSCRDISDIVWTEFKRSALIEIAQAQENLIEETKMSCVSTMKECYDTQTGALKDFDDTTAKAAGALSVYAAKSMCQDRVTRCAALYDSKNCTFDEQTGKLTSRCGLTALLEFVDTVDNVRVAEGCATAIDNYAQELCTPITGEMQFPWNCRKMPMYGDESSVRGSIIDFAVQNCSDPTKEEKTYEALPVQTRTQVEKIITNIEAQLDYQLMDACEALDGYWVEQQGTEKLLDAFYSTVFGGTKDESTTNLGVCVENSTRVQCLNYNEEGKEAVASYDLAKDECTFTDAWYEQQCSLMGNGYMENGVCYVAGE